MKTYHPRKDEHGQPVTLKTPSQSTALSSWLDPNQIASVTPDGPMPNSLNGIALTEWTEAPTTVEGWKKQLMEAGLAFEEPPMPSVSGKLPASGVVVLEDDGRVWVVSPSNAFGGYLNTFAKGKQEPGLCLRSTATKEGFEESGLKVELTAYLCDSVRSTTVTRYYTAKRMGGSPSAMGWESQRVSLVPRAQLASFVTHPNDHVVLQALKALP